MARRIIPSGHFHLARLLLLVDYLVICFDDVVLLRPRLGASCCSGWLPWFGCRPSLRLLLVERLSRLAEDLRQLFLSGADLVHVVAAERLPRPPDGGVHVERHLVLRHAPWRGRNSGELKLADCLVVRRELALTLKDMDLHRRLIVVSR